MLVLAPLERPQISIKYRTIPVIDGFYLESVNGC